MIYRVLRENDYEEVKRLSDAVFGLHYLTLEDIDNSYRKSCSKGLSSSFVLCDEDRIIGLRLTYAPGNWEIGPGFNPDKWKVPQDKVCYFQTNCIHPDYAGKGLGGELLKRSIEISKQQGAVAGLATIWLNSPHNSAFRYFSKAGGKVINIEQDRWSKYHTEDIPCGRCGARCECLGAEMILYF
jgi:ribosomal protein S18 acetylase RimI-like enzyme